MRRSEHAAPQYTDARDPVDTVNVVICAYTERRWQVLQDAVASVARQTRPAIQTVVVIDHNPVLLLRASEAFPDATVVANVGAQGLSDARNTGVAVAMGEIVAFLDDDAIAREDWLASLIGPYTDHRIIGTGGLVEPRWVNGGPTRWLPEEFYWTIGCSYTGLPTDVSPIRNPIGANMSFRREAIVRVGGFRDGVGRVGAIPLGCEETELAVRVARAYPRKTILYIPAAKVDHLIDPDRARWRYFRARCYAEGRSKAVVAAQVGTQAGLASERRYVLRALPHAVARELRSAAEGDVAGVARAAAIVAGLAITSFGYLRGHFTPAGRDPLGGDHR
jgi:O-antigen biosynthesis protein